MEPDTTSATPATGTEVNFLHIPKTGGSALKAALADYNKQETALGLLRTRRGNGHKFKLADFEGTQVFFTLRHPAARFVSAFYSRLRQGQPTHHFEWREGEAEVFTHYQTPDQLARDLVSPWPKTRKRAWRAMHLVPHFRRQVHWLVSLDYLRSREDDLVMVLFNESLDDDFAKLRSTLGLADTVKLPDDDVAAHRNPFKVEKPLSRRARWALDRWYAQDLAVIDYCRDLRARRGWDR